MRRKNNEITVILKLLDMLEINGVAFRILNGGGAFDGVLSGWAGYMQPVADTKGAEVLILY